MRPRVLWLRVGVVGLVLLTAPSVAIAQSTITGVVRDTSGAVLPGVTVEAASDALIERSRAVVTDGEGRYTIADLRPGQYKVTFALEGFSTVVRDGIDLPSSFTATVNGELRVGSLEESITVTGAAPTVDVTTAVHREVLSRDAMDAIPTGRSIQGMGQLVVGINLNLPDTGGARAMQQTYMTTHGMTTANNSVLVDGMMVNGLQADGAVQSYFNDAMNQEVSYQTSGIGADTSAGGVRLNMIPREGGNRFSGDFKLAYRPGEWQGDNLTERLQTRGLQTGNATDRIIDVTAAQGGPIKKDRLWIFGSARYFSVNNFIPNTFLDDGSRGVDDQFIKSAMVRLTWQVSGKHKLSAYFDEIDKFRGHDMQANYDPETAATVWNSPAYHTTSAKWTSTLTSKLLFEGGWSSNLEYYTNEYQPGIERPRGTDAWFTNVGRLESDLGGLKDATLQQITQSPARYAWMTALSYVTGSHNVKVGAQMTWGSFMHSNDANGDLYQRYRSTSTGIRWSVPDTVVVRNTPLRYGERLNRDLGFFAQDAWTFKRLTLNAGIRYEMLDAQVLAGESPAGRFVPARSFPERKDLPRWRNWAPRFSGVFDLFGNAKTALKYSLNRYNQARTTGIAANYNPLLSQTAALTWTDLNRDDVAQGARGCVFMTPGCEINFSQLPANFGTAALNEYGNYPRTWNLEHGVELQHELLPQLSLTGSWFHGNFHNLTATVNQNWTFADYTAFTVYNPVTGQPFTAYNRTPDAQARPLRLLDTFDPERERIYDAFMMEFRARPGRGAQVFGGFSFERQQDVYCTRPDDPNWQLFCDDRQNGIPFRKQFKVSGSYPLPWYGVIVSAAFQSNDSPRGPAPTFDEPAASGTRFVTLTRTTRYPASCPAPCPAGQLTSPALTVGSLTLPVQAFNASRIERINQLDFKIQRTFRFGRVTVLPTFEVFNINNSDAIISFVSANGLAAGFERPNSIMQGRIVGVGTQVRW